ncbi:MAG: hypothetical protein JNL57_02690 [Bacteroidetes bacterium]|nr:hypothetical protein [Bacteroidota bacterium]
MKTWLFLIFSIACKSATEQSQTAVATLPYPLYEISGLILHGGKFYALSDGGAPAAIYQIDTATGMILDSTTFSNTSNKDWEDLAVDGNWVYIGDFGNNNGTRRDLCIYRFAATQLNTKNVKCDTIAFQYAAQHTFLSNPLSNYDCEAFIVIQDTVRLFSKSKTDGWCRIYQFPALPGHHTLTVTDSFAPGIWVTGAGKYQNTISLCGYTWNSGFQPALIHGLGYIQGAWSKQTWNQPLTGLGQVESVQPLGACLWVAEEKQGTRPATLTRICDIANKPNTLQKPDLQISPNPTLDICNLTIPMHLLPCKLILRSASGATLTELNPDKPFIELDLSAFPAGTYTLDLQHKHMKYSYQLLRQ